MRIRLIAAFAALALLALGCDLNREARRAGAEADALRAEIAALKSEVDRLNAAVAIKDGLAAGRDGPNYITLDFFLSDFSVKPIGSRAEIGEFLGVYRGWVAICHAGGFGAYSWGRHKLGGAFSDDRASMPVQTSRPITSTGVVGSPQWILYPAEDGNEGYCKRIG